MFMGNYSRQLARDGGKPAFGAGVVPQEDGAVVAVAGADLRALVDHGLGVFGGGVAGFRYSVGCRPACHAPAGPVEPVGAFQLPGVFIGLATRHEPGHDGKGRWKKDSAARAWVHWALSVRRSRLAVQEAGNAQMSFEQPSRQIALPQLEHQSNADMPPAPAASSSRVLPKREQRFRHERRREV